MDNKKTSVFASRRFKYGSLSVALTVLLIVLIIIFNAAIYAVTYSFGWYLDLTGTQYYGITDASSDMLDKELTSDVKIKLFFCTEKDRILENEQSFYIYKCIESYQKKYPNNIKVEFLDINKHPEFVEKYTTQHGIDLYTYNIVMESNKSSSVRVLTYDDFFVFDSDTQTVYAFNGEARFTSYIMSLCAEAPICYFVSGHGESITDGQGNKNALWELMTDAGFDNRLIDLKQASATLDDAKVIVINAPQFDFNPEEIDKIGKFMADSEGNALIFLSPEVMVDEKKLTNFKDFLRQWGIKATGQLSDGINSLANTDGMAVMADYPIGGDGDFAPSLHRYMRQLDSQPNTIINKPLALECVWEGDAKGGREYDPVLYTHSSATLGNKSGQYAVAALVRNITYNNDTEQTFQSFMFVSSEGYTDGKYLNSNAYGNRDILYMIADTMGKEKVPVGIDMKVFTSEELAISTGAAYAWTVILVAAIPVAVMVTGGVICYRRRRS